MKCRTIKCTGPGQVDWDKTEEEIKCGAHTPFLSTVIRELSHYRQFNAEKSFLSVTEAHRRVGRFEPAA